MKRLRALSVLMVAMTLVPRGAGAPLPRGDDRLPDFDFRRTAGAQAVEWTAEQKAALEELRSRLPGAEAHLDPIVGSPKWLKARTGFLTGPHGAGRSVPSKANRSILTQDPDGPVKALLDEHRRLFGHGPEALSSARRARDYVTAHNGLHSTVWEQQLDGISVYEAVFVAHTTAQGEVASLSSQFVPDLERAAEPVIRQSAARHQLPVLVDAAVLTAIESAGAGAVNRADLKTSVPTRGTDQDQRFHVSGLPGETRARLVWLPLDGRRVRLCWEVELTRRQRGERFRVLVDAQNGQALLRRCLTYELSDATYRVFTSDSPSPYSPGLNTPGTMQPPLTSRKLVTLSALNTMASPLGWIRDGENETWGNNVDAHLDRDADNLADLPRPLGVPYRVFDFPLDLGQSPTNSSRAAVVQLFYWCNWMHDRLYELGFTEAAGNFQKDNFGRGGLGDDAVQADAQDGSGYNNANFTPSREGESPRLQMFLFNGPNPWRDADLDAEVILHEYTHGLSDRLVGGGVGFSSGNQPYGMAEGWSDFYALSLLSEAKDDPDGTYAYGGYMSYLLSGLTENYYFGIRRYPYTTDLSKNPLTFRDIYANDVPEYPGVPRNPISTHTGAEAHCMGEVWCSTLWQARANLVHKYGFHAGNELTLRLVTDGMKLSPANPTFIEARDAILLADEIDNGGTNTMMLWDAFAKRGLGVSASTIDAPFFGYNVAEEAFDTPDALQVEPADRWVISGPPGGPFTPPALVAKVSNLRTNTLPWSAQPVFDWLEITPSGGSLVGETWTSFAVRPAANALLLPAGVYSNLVLVLNQATGRVVTQAVVLKVSQQERLTGVFDQAFDDEYSTLTFWPVSSNSYSICRTSASAFPTDPTGGTDAALTDDSYRLVTLAGVAQVSIFGVRSNKFLLGSNGDVIYSPPSYYTYNPSLDLYTQYFHSGVSSFFERLRAGGLYADLNPSAGGEVSWKQLPDRVAITYQGVPEFGTQTANDFQIELFFNGLLRFTYLGIGVSSSIVGLSDGLGETNFVDLAHTTSCHPALHLVVPSHVVEGGTPQTGLAWLDQAATQNVVVHLQSSDSNSLSVGTVLIPAGQTSNSFSIIVMDDALLNGTRTVVITASAEQYDPASATILVDDNEIGLLTLTLPATATEGNGLLYDQGLISLNEVPAGPIVVSLLSSDPQLVSVPATVTIAEGQRSAFFDLQIGDNLQLDPPRNITVLASVRNWGAVGATIIVEDDEPPWMRLTLPAQVSETAGTLTNAGRVELGGIVQSNLTVQLTSDAPLLLGVPASVVVPAGQNSATFDLILVDNNFAQGDRPVQVSAAAPGLLGTNTSIVVQDDESPPPPTNPMPPDLAQRIPLTLTLAWGQEPRPFPGATVFDVYFGTNPAPSQAEFQGRTNASSWPLPVLSLGVTYYWQVVAVSGDGRAAGPVWRFTTARLSHFEMSPTPSPQQLGVSFTVSIEAKDENSQTASNFIGQVTLSALPSGAPGRTVRVAPEMTGPFVQGVWTGQLTVADPAAGLTLYAADGQGHTGSGSTFDVLAPDDLVLTLSPPPAVARIGNSFSYIIIVSNSGPTTATGVVFTDHLPPNVDLISTNVSQGSCNSSSNQVICQIGTLEAGAWAIATVQVEPTALGTLTNTVSVTRMEPETYLDNNAAISVTPVEYPWLIPAASSVLEGDSGTTSAVFPVVLSDPSSRTVSVNFSTSDGTATAGSDYEATNGTLVFPPGVTNAEIAVIVHGDTNSESSEIFSLNFFQPVDAVLATNEVSGTIVNDDAYPPIGISVSDASTAEGDQGTTDVAFALTLTSAADRIVSVYYQTADGTAVAGSDYIASSGWVDFPVGVTNRTISISVVGDTQFEGNEYFFVMLNRAVNGFFRRRVGVGMILDDDTNKLDHFTFDSVGVTQFLNVPFPARITAMDVTGQPVTNFNGSVSIQAGHGAQSIALGAGTNLWEYPFGASYEDARVQAIYPGADIGRSGRITALSLQVAQLPQQILTNWTIRLKHTSQESYSRAAWEAGGWTRVYQANQAMFFLDWITFPFQTPFDYNGLDNLMVDLSFNNGRFSSNGLCYATVTDEIRALAFRTDSAFGDPLDWAGVSPPPLSVKLVPNIQFSLVNPVAMTPGTSGSFVNGVWNGDLDFLDLAPDVVLLAQDTLGHSGRSSAVQVVDPETGSSVRIAILQQPDGNLRLTFATTAGARYQIERADTLGTWSPLNGPIIGNGLDYQFIDAPLGFQSRFYRVRLSR